MHRRGRCLGRDSSARCRRRSEAAQSSGLGICLRSLYSRAFFSSQLARHSPLQNHIAPYTSAVQGLMSRSQMGHISSPLRFIIYGFPDDIGMFIGVALVFVSIDEATALKLEAGKV